MSHTERQIQVTRHRLWINRWLRFAAWALTIATVAFAVFILIQRLYDFHLSVGWIALSVTTASFLSAFVFVFVTRESVMKAATALDDAAGLRERLSSSLYCAQNSDPYAQAVVQDAERVSSSVSARQHIPIVVPTTFAWTGGSLLLAAAMFLITPGLLKKIDADTIVAGTNIEQTRTAVKREIEEVRRITENNPALEGITKDLASVTRELGGKYQKPQDLRLDAVKKIESLTEAIKKKQAETGQDALPALEHKLRSLQSPNSQDTPTEKLTKALRDGDFKSAKEEVETIKEKLATLKSEEDKEMAENLSKQLENLSQQLEQAAQNQKLAEKLEQAGIKKEDVQRAMESLKKEDLDQLQKQLEQKGMSQQQAQKMAEELRKQQQAGSVAQKLAQSMKQGAQCKNQGQMGDAMAGLSDAAQQLGDLEKLDQELSEMQSTMQALNNAKQNMDKPCPGPGNCSGCSQCKGSGGDKPGQGGMGEKMGQGRGGLAEEEEVATGFKIERGKVHTSKGAVIGSFKVDGEQIKGDAKSQPVDVVASAERDASDRIQRDRIPRQYHKAIKKFFSNAKLPPAKVEGVPKSDTPAEAPNPAPEKEPTKTPSEEK
ncbi:MAG: hypothetical protein AABZ47_07055 [Planctomycetota bacterium]